MFWSSLNGSDYRVRGLKGLSNGKDKEPSLVLGGTGAGKRNANNSPLMQFLVVFMPDLNRYFANRLHFVSAALRTSKWPQFLKILRCLCHTEICLCNVQEKCPGMGSPVPGDLTELSQDLRD